MRIKTSAFHVQLFIALSALFLASPCARGQQPSTGVILGQVLDSLGVPRWDVEVRLTSPDGTVLNAVTDRDGVYIFRDLPFGEFRIEAADASYPIATAKLTSGEPNAMRDLAPAAVVYTKKRKKAAPKKAFPPPPPPPPAPPPAASITPPENNLALKTVYFATDRASSGVTILPASFFTGDRHPQGKLTYGTCDVNVPINHIFGQLETPDIFKLEFSPDPKKHFFVKSLNINERDPFYVKLSEAVEKSPQRQAFVFVHGYNVSFESAALRTAQMAVDLKFDGAPIFYSWPSRGRLSGYRQDEESVKWTVDHLRQFLEEVATRSGARKVHLIAHSMGSRALTQAMAALGRQPAANRIKFQELILAAPDLDVAVFQGMEAAIRSSASHLTLYASSRDKALIASDLMHFLQRRLGQAGHNLFVDPQILDTIDATAIDTDFLDHSYFSDSSILLDLVQLLIGNKRTGERAGLTPRQSTRGTYWQYDPTAAGPR